MHMFPTLTITCQTQIIYKKAQKRKSQNLMLEFENTKQHGGGKTASELNRHERASNFIKFNQGRIGPSLNANFLPDFSEILEYTNIVCNGKRR